MVAFTVVWQFDLSVFAHICNKIALFVTADDDKYMYSTCCALLTGRHKMDVLTAHARQRRFLIYEQYMI